MAKLGVLLIVICVSFASLSSSHSFHRRLEASYDYIVIDAGAAGLTVANRLSDNPGEFIYKSLKYCRISC
jgi:hypothetical protein